MSEIMEPEENRTLEQSNSQQVMMKRTDSFEHKPAGFWIRFWAYIVDMLILSSIGMLLIKPIFRLLSLELNDSTWYAPITLITALLFYAYFVLMTKFFSQTVGKMIFGIKVISKDKKSLSWGTVLFREWIGRLISIIPLNLPYLAVAFTPKKQAIHDMIADTLVIHEAVYDKTEKIEYIKPPVAKELQENNMF